MRKIRLVLSTTALVALGGCTEGGSARALAGPSLSVSDTTSGFVVRGDVSSPSGTGRRLLTLKAIRKADGTADGTYRVHITATDAFFTVDVTCMTVLGNTAWVAGIIRGTNSGAIVVGSVSYFFLVDNGTPSDTVSAADVVSTARINDAAGQDLAFCNTMPLQLPTLAGLKGDIQLTATR